MRAQTKKDDSLVKRFKTGSLLRHLKECHDILLVGKITDASDAEVAELKSLKDARKISGAMVVAEAITRTSPADAISIFNMNILKKLAPEVTVSANKLSFELYEKMETVSCQLGYANWGSCAALKQQQVPLLRATLAMEIASDVKILGGKPKAIKHTENSLFKGFGNESQAVAAKESLAEVELNVTDNISGAGLAHRVYKELMEVDLDAMKGIMNDIQSRDPPACNQEVCHEDVKYKLSGKTVTGTRRSKTFGHRIPAKSIKRDEWVAYNRLYTSYVGENRGGIGKMLSSFYYGVPLESQSEALSILSIVTQLKDKTTPIYLDVTNESIAIFLSQNRDRAVGYLSKDNPMTVTQIRDAIAKKGVFRYYSTEKQIGIFMYVDKTASVQLDVKDQITYNTSQVKMCNLMKARPVRSVFYVHAFSVVDYLSSNDTFATIEYEEEKMLVYMAPSLQLECFNLVGANFDAFSSNVPGLEMNFLLKTFMMNAPLFRYHTLPLASFIADKKRFPNMPICMTELKFRWIKLEKSKLVSCYGLDEALLSGTDITDSWDIAKSISTKSVPVKKLVPEITPDDEDSDGGVGEEYEIPVAPGEIANDDEFEAAVDEHGNVIPGMDQL
jgi:hypothetical protein